MTNDEISGRLCVLEVFSMTALGLYLANTRNDPDYGKAAALLQHLRDTVSSLANALPISARPAAESYADQLVARLSENLRTMRGEGGQSH
jgi:hypothetical protein